MSLVTRHCHFPRFRKVIDQWVEEKRIEALKDINLVMDTYRRRAAIIGFR